MAPRTIDGGYWALAGFLYQMVGLLSVTAEIAESASNADDSDELNAFLQLSEISESFIAKHEHLGQDAVLIDENDDLVLVQFKYSTSSPARKIGRSDLEEIIRKLDDSANNAVARGDRVTACVLITNREFTSRGGNAAEQLWEREQSIQRGYELRRFGSSMRDWIEALRNFGRHYGATEREIETGVNDLIGRLLYETGQYQVRGVARTDLVGAFTGTRRARSIRVTDVEDICRQKLDRLKDYLNLDQWDNRPVSREIVGDIFQAMRERALIGIHGQGGCGKSVMLWQILTQCNRLFSYEFARDIGADWIVNMVHRWRRIPAGRRPDDSTEIALDRLKIANPDIERPVIWLGLDGLDEDIAQGPREDIRQILRWFWHRDEEARAGQTPLATLIVTYRSRNQLRHWLKLPHDYPGDTPLSFELDYFSEEEAERALAMIFPDILGRNSGMGADETSLTLEDRDWFSPEQPTISSRREYRIEPEIFQTLRHPVMWRALLYLSDDLSRQVLLGNQDAIRLWAEAYIRWFFDKLRRRNSLLVGDLRELEELLHAVAVRSQNYLRLRRNNHWVQPMCDTDLVNVTMATELYNEARSGGLIAQDERNNWRWQHTLVRDYLIEVR